MKKRLSRLLAADTTWLEVLLTLLTLLWGVALGRAEAIYYTAAVFAPIAPVIPHAVMSAIPVVLAGCKVVSLWHKLSDPPCGLSFRFAVVTTCGVFWLLLTILFWIGSPNGLSAVFYIGLVVAQVFLFYRLWLEWLAEQEARLHGPDHH